MNNKDNINIIDDISTILENIEEITPEQKLKNIEELLKIYKSQEVYKRRKRIAIKALNNPPSITNLLIKSAKDGEDTENPHHVYLGGAIFTQIYSAQKNKLITKSVLTEIVEEFENGADYRSNYQSDYQIAEGLLNVGCARTYLYTAKT